MASVRELKPQDLPEVARLFLRLTPEAGWPSGDACAGYLRDILFGNPWADLEIPSWVAEDGGRITAFYLLLPRRMLLGNRPIRVAVGCQMSVDESHRRSLTALALAKAALTGPQDLTIADGAHERSRDMWIALGGQAPLAYNLHWIRPLRPARAVLTALGARGVLPAPLRALARLPAALVDAAVRRLRWNRLLTAEPELESRPLVAAELADCFGEIVTDELRPAYDAATFDWLIRETLAKTGHGGLRGRLLHGPDGRACGWYVYQLVRGGTSEVIQLAARRGEYERVLRHLLGDAWRQGAAALRGRGEPDQVEALSAHHAWFRREGKCALVHSRDPRIRNAIEQGRAFLSRWEGEWWLRHVTA